MYDPNVVYDPLAQAAIDDLKRRFDLLLKAVAVLGKQFNANVEAQDRVNEAVEKWLERLEEKTK